MSFVLAGVASALALARPDVERLDADLASPIRADYSADPDGTTLAPLDEGIIDVARQDVDNLRKISGVEIVPVFVLDDPGDGTVTQDDGGSTPEPATTPVPGTPPEPGTAPVPGTPPEPGTAPVPGTPPEPGTAPVPTPTPLPTPTPIPPPSWCGVDVNVGFVQNTSPCNGATGVPLTVVLIVQFNQPMNSATINSQNLKITSVPIIVTYDPGTNQATIAPLQSLTAGKTYKLKVDTDVENADGNKGIKVEVSFTTAP